MSTTYLFHTGNQRDNDNFFNATRPSEERFFYRGTRFQVGTESWEPDLVRVEIEDSPSHHATVILIELEESEGKARASCRKYSHEASQNVLDAIHKYLGCIITECEASAALSRINEFKRLKTILTKGIPITVKTAGALRSGPPLIEEHLLNDQPKAPVTGDIQEGCQKESKENARRICRGEAVLYPPEPKELSRCILILDAVIRGEEYNSNAKFHNWRIKAPLKSLLGTKDMPLLKDSPSLNKLMLEAGNHGLGLNYDVLLSELAAIWKRAAGERPYGVPDVDRARALIETYWSIASRIKPNERMGTVFQAARLLLKV